MFSWCAQDRQSIKTTVDETYSYAAPGGLKPPHLDPAISTHARTQGHPTRGPGIYHLIHCLIKHNPLHRMSPRHGEYWTDGLGRSVLSPRFTRQACLHGHVPRPGGPRARELIARNLSARRVTTADLAPQFLQESGMLIVVLLQVLCGCCCCLAWSSRAHLRGEGQ